jgi:glycosyltransferase involved in cell wall biosynthesis
LKVVHLIPQDSLGGAETAAREMACRADLDCDFRLISMAGELLAKGQPRFSGLGFKSPLNPFAHFAAVRAILALEPDVLISSLWKSAPAAILAKLLRPKMKLVAFFHSAERTHGLDRIFHNVLLRAADMVWADSAATLETARDQRPGLPTRVISYVIDETPPANAPRQAKARFISWSRIHHHKGMDRSLELVARLVARGVDARFDIWGPDQGPRADLERQAKRLNIAHRVRFHGAVERSSLADIAAEASFLLQLSRLEGMAMVVVEAMQLGLVPVVTAAGEVRRYCRDGQNALLVDVDDLDKEADRIAALLNDAEAYRRMSRAAHDQWQGCRTYAGDVCAAASELVGRAR